MKSSFQNIRLSFRQPKSKNRTTSRQSAPYETRLQVWLGVFQSQLLVHCAGYEHRKEPAAVCFKQLCPLRFPVCCHALENLILSEWDTKHDREINCPKACFMMGHSRLKQPQARNNEEAIKISENALRKNSPDQSECNIYKPLTVHRL